jgi:YVTN family beta-propeller protein
VVALPWATSLVEFQILGPLEVLEHDRPLVVGGPKVRALLAMLLLHRGEVVSTDRLIDALWAERASATAAKTVHVYVSNLRKALGDGLLVTRGHGYLLQTGTGQLDLDRFEALVAEGRRDLQAGDGRAAGERLQEALALWRGPALADFAYEPFAQNAIARLEEARLAALEDRIDADLAIGEQAGLVGELETLVAEHPLRERLQRQLMLALYRSGRQAEALESYRDARQSLIDELGLEPGRDLQELEQAILAQDPALEPPSQGSRLQPVTVARRARRGAWLIAAAGAVLLAAIAGVAIKLSGSSPGSVQVPANSVAVIDPHSNTVVGSAPVGSQPGAIAFGSGSLWVANVDDQTVSRIDPGSLRPLRTLAVGDPPTGIATSAGAVWVVGSNPNATSVSVSRIDPQFDAVASAAAIRVGNVVPGGPGEVAANGGAVWVAPSSGVLARLNPTTGRVVQRIDPNAGPTAIDIGDGAVWVTDTFSDNVTRVDPTGLATPIAVGGGPSGIAVGEGGVWVADSLDDTVTRIDPNTRAVTMTIPVGRSPAGVAAGAGSVWVANSGDGTVTRIDPRTDKVQATITVGGSPQAITIANGRAWVTIDAAAVTPSGTAGGTLRIDSQIDVDYMDPARAYTVLSQQLLYATCAKLLNYPDMSGVAGRQLKAEVASSLPTRSADGKTYTFTIRPGFRFSPPSNQPVTAQTFKDTIERTLNPRMKSPIAFEFSGVVGADAYMTARAAHISGIVASGDTLTIHLLAPVPDLPSRLAQPGFCAVPSDTPINTNGERTIPSAGPYYVSSYTPNQGIVLVRNPNYRGSRPHHFDRIVLAVGTNIQRSVDDVERGAADYTTLITPGAALSSIASRLDARYGPGSEATAHGSQQYFVNPQLELDFFDLNTHRRPFSDVRLRRAVNYAIDRRALARLGNPFAPLPERPADHYLPPGLPGFSDTHAYPLTPDLAKARALAGSKIRTAVLYTCNLSPCDEQAQIVKNDLAAIGLHVEIKTFPAATLIARTSRRGEPFDLAWNGWVLDYPDPAALLNEVLDNSSAFPTLDDPTYQRRLAHTAALTGPERYLAYGKLDIDLARNAAPLIAIGNPSSHDFFSARIGCQTYGIYGIDLAALCIKR